MTIGGKPIAPEVHIVDPARIGYTLRSRIAIGDLRSRESIINMNHEISKLLNFRGGSYLLGIEVINCLEEFGKSADRADKDIIDNIVNRYNTSAINGRVSVQVTAELVRILAEINSPKLNNNKLRSIIANFKAGAVRSGIADEQWVIDTINVLVRLNASNCALNDIQPINESGD